jgi:pyrimidine-nucleoside phosphorylase
MISGRGLGHTGGTLDKLASIPGFTVDLPVTRYRELVRSVGTCLMGQTATLAPADKRLYALRDVTATVDCIPLIASSIMSKKLAEGIDALVLDVKVGSGAFMKTLPEARVLARTMVRIGAEMGKRVVALLTDMSQPLGRTVGNALEIKEAVAVLRGEAPADLTLCTLALCGEMLLLAGLVKTASEAESLLAGHIRDGSAFEKLCEVATAQGGDARALRDLSRLPSARTVSKVTSLSDGFVTAIDAEAVGLSAMALGAGRERVDGTIDPAVGIVLEKKVGDRVARDEPLALLHVNDDARAKEVARRVRAAYRVEEAAAPAGPLVRERIDA